MADGVMGLDGGRRTFALRPLTSQFALLTSSVTRLVTREGKIEGLGRCRKNLVTLWKGRKLLLSSFLILHF